MRRMTAPSPARPTGLSILAVLNLAFGLFAVLTGILLVVGLRVHADPSAAPEGIEPQLLEKFQALPDWFMYMEIGASMGKAATLIASGIGYLGQSRILGRWVATLYAVISITESLVAVFGLGGAFDWRTTLGLAYPTLTLIMVHSVFKDDLVK